MKQIVLVILFFAPLFLLGQTTFQFEASKDISLSTAISTVSENYNIQFAFPSDLPDNIIINSQIIDQQSLDGFMSELLKHTSIEFQCTGNKKVLLRKQNPSKNDLPQITLHGFIKDETTNQLLTHGAVYLEDMSVGTFTDENGKFEITIRKKDFNKNVVISFLGFEEQIVPIQTLKEKRNFFLKPQSIEIENIIISHTMPGIKSDLNDNSMVLNRKYLSKNKANFLGGSDLLKSVQMLPGVSADDDSSSDIKIRGSNADETMLLLDGMPIYNADHYYGIFSSIQSHYVEEVRLYKNIFPIQYSGVTAGLLKMDSGDYSPDLNGTLSLNTLSGSIAVQSPISKNISINLGGRTSIGNVSQYNILSEPEKEFELPRKEDHPNKPKGEKFQQYKPDFKFYDINAKLNTKISDKSSLSFSFFNSADFYNNEYERTFESKGHNNQDQKYSEEYKLEHAWKNLVGGSSFHHDFSATFSMDASAHVSQYFEESKLAASIEIEEQNIEMEHSIISTGSTNEIQDIGLNIAFVQSKKNPTTFGLAINQYATNYELYNADIEVRDTDTRATKLTGFGSYKFDWKKLNLEVGARGTFYNANFTKRRNYNDFFLSPQLLATYQFNNVNAIKCSVGRNQQFLREIEYEDRVGQWRTIYGLANDETVGVSDNYMFGYQFKNGNWLVDFELFYKDMDGVVEFTNVNPGFQDDLPGQQPPPKYRLFSGNGESYGLDFLINYQSKNYHTWIAYTLSKTTNQMDSLFNNNPYPNQNDRRHQLKWINNYRYKKFNFSLNTVFSNGKPYLAIQNLSNSNKEEFDPETSYNRLPYYGRIDFGVSYNLKVLKQDASIGVSCFNITNRQNVKFNQQTYSVNHRDSNQNNFSSVIGSESELLDRTLDFNFIMKF